MNKDRSALHAGTCRILLSCLPEIKACISTLDRRLVITFAAAILFCNSLLVAQSTPQCGLEVLAKIGEASTDLTPKGISTSDSMIILVDGRFQLKRRFQQLPSTTLTQRVFQSALKG